MMDGIIDFHCHLKDHSEKHLLEEPRISVRVVHPAFEDFNHLEKYHETIAKILEKYAGKLKAFIGIDFNKEPEKILDDIAFVGAAGIKIHPLLQGIKIQDKEFMKPFMSVIKKSKLPLYVHTDHPGVPIYYKYRTLLKSRFGRLAKNFPDVNPIIMGHAGNNDSYLDAKDVIVRRDNVLVETSLSPVPSEIEKIVKRVNNGENRILFGSNEPYSSFQVEVKKIEILSITDEQKRKILSENARRLLKL
ncbi:MAG: amidohydrolase family protein [Promethearchaeota archaeon]